MVDSSQVNSDSNSFSSSLKRYSSIVSDFSNGWKGISYDNLENKANGFVFDFSDKIGSQFSSFASACDLYKNYEVEKKNLEILKSNYNEAISANDDVSAASYSRQISEKEATLKSLKTQIEALLSKISGISLSMSTTLVSSVDGGKDSDKNSGEKSNCVSGAIDWALAIADDNSYGYSQGSRWGNPNYDCSSFVISAYQAAGINVKDAGATYTGNMREVFESLGFTWIPGNPDVNDLQPGDVLLNESSHVEMYIGNGKNIGAHDNYDGYDGDSSGEEISVSDYYSFPWDGILRYTGNR